MQTLNEYALTNSAYTEIVNDLTRLTEVKDHLITTVIPNIEIKLKYIKDIKTELLNCIDNITIHGTQEEIVNLGFSVHKDVITNLDNRIENLNIGRTTNRLSGYKLEVSSTIQQIVELSEKLNNFSANKLATIIKITEIEQKLYQLPNIIPNSVKLERTLNEEKEEVYLSWGLTGIYLTPNENPYLWINDGKPISIALADIKITIELLTSQVVITAYDISDTTARPYVWNNNHNVHPHILSGNKPCLGDWGGPIMEAISEYDWATVSGMFTLFLSNAYNSDGAGKSWYLGVLNTFYKSSDVYVKKNKCILEYPNKNQQNVHSIAFYPDKDNIGKFNIVYLNADGKKITTIPPTIFKIGDTVMIHPESVYYHPNRTSGSNPSNVEGIIKDIKDGKNNVIKVSWPSGSNYYNNYDLVLIENPTSVLPKSINEVPKSSIPFPVRDVSNTETTILDYNEFDMITNNDDTISLFN
jgi:hypothetical protein